MRCSSLVFAFDLRRLDFVGRVLWNGIDCDEESGEHSEGIEVALDCNRLHILGFGNSISLDFAACEGVEVLDVVLLAPVDEVGKTAFVGAICGVCEFVFSTLEVESQSVLGSEGVEFAHVV